jgi:hypothetical protein
MVNHPNRKQSIPPAAKRYMKEFGETEAEFKKWLGIQKDAHAAIADCSDANGNRIGLAVWVAYKMGCSAKGAKSTLTWAGITET